MSFDEDFSLVSEDDQRLKLHLGGILKEINKCKLVHEGLLKEQKLLAEARDGNVHFAQQFSQRSMEKRRCVEEEQRRQAEELEKEQRRLGALHEDQSRLREEITKVEEDLQRLEERNHNLRQQQQVSTAVPEKKVVFNGETAEGANALSFDMKPKVVYPMEGGTALITFEEEAVAQNIVNLAKHEVQFGDCNVTLRLQAKPVQLPVPSYVEVDTQVCPQRILVSNLPKKKNEEWLLDKLELHFCRKKHGGGEVDETDMLHDSGNAVITFTESNIARGLTDKQDHEVEMGKGKRHKVKVTPFLNGEIMVLQNRDSVCPRTVLLTGIPNIMEQDNLQDVLEIHFQKTSNGGGEVDAIVYNPLGLRTLAVFEEDSPKEES